MRLIYSYDLQDPSELPPAMIDIKVTHEVDGDMSDGRSIEMISGARLQNMRNSASVV